MLQLESELSWYIDRMKAAEKAKKQAKRSAQPKARLRMSWGEAALTAGIKDEKVNNMATLDARMDAWTRKIIDVLHRTA